MAEETVLGGNEEQSIFVNLQKFSFDDLVPLIAIPTTQTVIVTRMGRKKHLCPTEIF